MSENDSNNNNHGDGKPGGDSGFNWRGLVLLSIAVSLIAAAFLFKGGDRAVQELSWPQFKTLLDEGKIVTSEQNFLEIVRQEGSAEEFVRGVYRAEDPNNPGELIERGFKTVVHVDFAKEELLGILKEHPDIQHTFVVDRNWGGAVIVSLLPILLILLILYFFFRQQVRMAGRGAMSFGKSKAKMMAADDSTKISFKDVAGVEEAKEEVWEIVEFLKDPKKFQRLGGRIPKGVLMVGPPGTGKTLLARAIAGEANVPFFTISGSDFVEMFVGVGASRVRDMFEQGKKNAPCLIFIDEIDAVGRHRGHGLGGGHDEREQTLNALLVEMDGFDTQEGVIILAATNRPDVLDPALLRPGRFDRQINVSLPDVKGRHQILKVHAKKVKIAEDVDLGVLARGTPGYSGAELANVINEAALLAARRNLKAITLEELEEARDKVRWGRERRSLAISEKEKKNTAVHEAGHALLLVLLENTEPLHKVTIIPRGPSLGATMWLPEEDKYNLRKAEIVDGLVVAMGGRVAEEIVFGDVTSGASGDIKMATAQARKMVCEWGMSEKMGMVEYGESHEQVFLARDLSAGGRGYSEATAQEIDSEVKRLIDEAYGRATGLITKNRDKLDVIAEALLEFETLDGDQIAEIMEHGKLLTPPSSPQPPDLPEDEEPEGTASPRKEASDDDDE
ncbi:MAG: ATP-dependent zinc metalloprotease FtsH, partial [Verrucomicrobiales bacterium]